MHQETKFEMEEFKCSIDFYFKYATRYNCGIYFTMCMLLGTTAVYTSPCFPYAYGMYMICACTCEFTNSNYHISPSRPRLEWV